MAVFTGLETVSAGVLGVATTVAGTLTCGLTVVVEDVVVNVVSVGRSVIT